MKSILFSLLLSLTAFTLLSCSKSNPAGPSGSQQILPLKLGDAWVMRFTVYDTSGAVEGAIYDTATVATDTAISGVTWYHTTSRVFGGLIADESDGLWTYSSPSGASLAFKYPANVGDSWSAQMDASTTYQVTLQSDSTSVTVPKGTYSCYDWTSPPHELSCPNCRQRSTALLTDVLLARSERQSLCRVSRESVDEAMALSNHNRHD